MRAMAHLTDEPDAGTRCAQCGGALVRIGDDRHPSWYGFCTVRCVVVALQNAAEDRNKAERELMLERRETARLTQELHRAHRQVDVLT